VGAVDFGIDEMRRVAVDSVAAEAGESALCQCDGFPGDFFDAGYSHGVTSLKNEY